ncbi:hypothetical protein ABVK25_010016 [Lepraria finkii]|uniref:N-acetyltransferase domain-containing protein n=1 Tax=Lepraria finkii TaxID=1340010 RepID=A0ABR4AW27_9LECA
MAISDLSNKRALHTLQTERLFLRAAQASDLDDLFEIFNNDDVMKYWSCPPHTDKEQTNSYLTSMIASPTNGTLDFSLVLSSPRSFANGKVIGKDTWPKL